jgi:hypothetical protein
MANAKKTSANAKETSGSIDPKAAEKAFNALKPRLTALSPDRFATLSVDLEKAAVAAAAIGRMVKGKAMRARFTSLPKKYFDRSR